jgi:hypothetical protein
MLYLHRLDDVVECFSMKIRQIIGFVVLLHAFDCLYAAPPVMEAAKQGKTIREQNLAEARALDVKQALEYGANTNFFLRPGVMADRTKRTVKVAAETIALEDGNPVEFSLVTPDSGKDYEARAVSFATAEDVHHALEFIGLQAGQGVSESLQRFWPKGDRVRVTFRYADSAPSPSVPPHPNQRARPAPRFSEVNAERLVLNTKTGKTLPEVGFVFTGSERRAATEPPATGTVYVADAFSPGSIISLYNEPFTVLDVPRRAVQQEVYRLQVLNPDCGLPPNKLVEIVLEPFYRDGAVHRAEYSLVVAPDDRNEAVYSLVDAAKQTVNTNRSLPGFLATLGLLTGKDGDVFVTFRPDDALSLKTLAALAKLLESLDTERGVRLDGTPEGHLYYKAFMPKPAHRRREERPASTAELVLGTHDGATTGLLVFVDSEWKADSDTTSFRETALPVSTPDGLEAAFAASENPPRVVLVFAPGTLTYGALRHWAAPLLKRNLILYVFLPES